MALPVSPARVCTGSIAATTDCRAGTDVYCYACDDARVDPHLAKHLGNFGIQVAEQKKTEKSMTELVRSRLRVRAARVPGSDLKLAASQQVEQNLTFDFAMTGADGKELEPLFGPGLTGMKNLGNRSAFLRCAPARQHR